MNRRRFFRSLAALAVVPALPLPLPKPTPLAPLFIPSRAQWEFITNRDRRVFAGAGDAVVTHFRGEAGTIVRYGPLNAR